MNELSTHIEYLLLTHDCVVVPQFGAFMAQQSSATHSEEEQLFFPPLRRVRFNADVTADDGLLVASVAACHDVDETQAKRLVQTMVLNLRQQLLADGQVDFGSIGLFTQDEDGRVEFSSCQAGAVSPDFYGLDVFQLQKVELINKGTRARRHRQLLSRDESESHITIHINRRMLRQAFTTAAAVMLCVLCTVPLRDSSNGGAREATLTYPVATTTTVHATPGNADATPSKAVSTKAPAKAPASDATHKAVVPQAPNKPAPATPAMPGKAETETAHAATATAKTPAAETVASKAHAKAATSTATVKSAPASAAPKAAPSATPAKAVPATAKASDNTAAANSSVHTATAKAETSIPSAEGAPAAYAIVLASNTSEANARDFVARLKAMGYDNARIYNNGRLLRVILDGYKTESAALDAKHRLQWLHDGFDDAWLLRP